MQTGRLDAGKLEDLVREGEVDTVLMVFPDQQGRFMGKRVTGHFFLDNVLGGEGSIHACNYLLAVDMEMAPLPGYAYTSWDAGYGDLRMVPDLNTLRLVPWLEKTALVICDCYDEHEDVLIEVAPRTILRRQVERAAAVGCTWKIGSELEFYLFKDSFDEASGHGYRGLTPHSSYIMDYHILQTTKDEYLIRELRNSLDAAGVPVEFSKGEFGRGQHEINVRYAEALEMADRHSIFKNAVKEIAHLRGRAVTFMAKWAMAEAGSSCHIHSSVWSADGSRSLMWDEGGPQHMSPAFRHCLGGLIATAREMAWMFAPNVNSYKRYQLGSWAPTAVVWGMDNRTCGFRLVGKHQGFRVESRIPGSDANPYYAFAATIAAGLYGIRQQIEPPDIFAGNAYEAAGIPRVPSSLHEAVALMDKSEIMRESFGHLVFEHLLNTARQEQISFDNQVVTDWELARYFERT